MKPGKEHLQITFKVATDKMFVPIVFTFEHTKHSYLRSRQRGLNQEKIVATLQYGENIYKQGLIYFILGENNIPDSLVKEKERLKNTVVIVAGDSNQIITCYRSAKPFKNVRIKSKNLSKRYKHAA